MLCKTLYIPHLQSIWKEAAERGGGISPHHRCCSAGIFKNQLSALLDRSKTAWRGLSSGWGGDMLSEQPLDKKAFLKIINMKRDSNGCYGIPSSINDPHFLSQYKNLFKLQWKSVYNKKIWCNEDWHYRWWNTWKQLALPLVKQG